MACILIPMYPLILVIMVGLFGKRTIVITAIATMRAGCTFLGPPLGRTGMQEIYPVGDISSAKARKELVG